MIKKILTPLDGSAAAEAGLEWARPAAAKCGATLQLLTVVPGDGSDGDAHVEHAEEYLKARRDDLAVSGLSAESEVRRGDAAELILERAASAEVTVMTYGAGRATLGGSLELVLHRMDRPVVAVRAGVPPVATSNPKILVPLDRAATSNEILSAVQLLATSLNASAVLCHVIEPIGLYRDPANAPPGIAAILDDLIRQARAELGEAATQLTRAGVEVEIVVQIGEPESELAHLAGACGAMLIAMATRGHDELSRVMGSVSYSVMHSTRIPCLLVRPAGTRITGGLEAATA